MALMGMIRRCLLPVACILGWLPSCIATLSNRTIDDTKGDPITGFLPIYAPESHWNLGTNCSGCLVQPDIGQLFDYTWHDTTQGDGGVSSSVTLNFTGTAIYLFCVIPNTIPFTTTLVDLKFTLDGALISTYTHIPDSSADILYSVPVLSSQDLSNEAHTLIAETASNSLFVFDFAMDTFDDSPPAANTTTTSVVLPASSTQTSNTASSTGTSRGPQPLVAAVAAGSISAAAIVALLLIAILWVKRRRRQAARSEDLERSRPDMNISNVQPLARELPVSSSTLIPEEPVLPPYAPVDPHANPSAVMESFSVPTSTKGIKKIADRP